jgi:DNA-binding response OmpR family regulator
MGVVPASPVTTPPPAPGAVATRTILVVEDEATIAQAVAARLRSEGYAVEIASDGPSAIDACDRLLPDLVVLDLMLPGLDGLEVCKRIQRDRPVPVLMLTARDSETDLVVGLAVGADDYLTKPFSMRELAARVRAIIRRMERIEDMTPSDSVVRFDLTVDAARRRVLKGTQEVPLTPLEFEILLTLARSPGVVLSRDQLMDRVWGYRDYAGGRVVDSHVARIRRKLGDEAAEPKYIRTVHGVGYAFREDGLGP